MTGTMNVLYTLSATAGIAGVFNFTRLMNTPIKDPEEAYELLYQKLRAFKVTHSHCNVPQGYPDKKLADFVGTIRILKKRRQLEPERVERLDSLGFSW
jgi:helicase associated protein